MSMFKDNYEGALWAIANGNVEAGSSASAADKLGIIRRIAQEALGDKWTSYLAEVETTVEESGAA